MTFDLRSFFEVEEGARTAVPPQSSGPPSKFRSPLKVPVPARALRELRESSKIVLKSCVSYSMSSMLSKFRSPFKIPVPSQSSGPRESSARPPRPARVSKIVLKSCISYSMSPMPSKFSAPCVRRLAMHSRRHR